MNIKAFDIYGLSEIIGPGVSGECSAQNGLHVWEDHFMVEVIDPNTGAVLPYGQKGELVFTCITKEALPLIRYRTRDISILYPEVLHLRPDSSAHEPGHGPDRRYVNYPWRKCLPFPD